MESHDKLPLNELILRSIAISAEFTSGVPECVRMGMNVTCKKDARINTIGATAPVEDMYS